MVQVENRNIRGISIWFSCVLLGQYTSNPQYFLQILDPLKIDYYVGWSELPPTPPPNPSYVGGGHTIFWGVITRGGIRYESSMLEQIPMGGYIVSIFAKILGSLWWKNAPQPAKSNIGQPPSKFEKIVPSKYRHVGCLSRGNGLQCWRVVLRYWFRWAYLEIKPPTAWSQSTLWY